MNPELVVLLERIAAALERLAGVQEREEQRSAARGLVAIRRQQDTSAQRGPPLTVDR